jgi:hypothetical protein
MRIVPKAREIPVAGSYSFKYSVCTLVTNPQEYGEMMESFVSAGFGSEDCEYLYIDNSQGNKAEAYSGYNLFLNAAQGQYVILCHQDILLKFDDRRALELCISELDKIDPVWALAGNAGGIAPERWAARVTHPSGGVNTGSFPKKAQSLDENFILIKKGANLCLSRDLQGFHFHGMELCQIGRILGWNAWVINFNLYHKSEGNFDESFHDMAREVVKKYQRALKGGLVQTIGAKVHLSNSAIQNWIGTPSRRRLTYEYFYHARKRKKKGLAALPVPPEFRRGLGPGWTVIYWLAHRIRRPIENLMTAAARMRRPVD